VKFKYIIPIAGIAAGFLFAHAVSVGDTNALLLGVGFLVVAFAAILIEKRT